MWARTVFKKRLTFLHHSLAMTFCLIDGPQMTGVSSTTDGNANYSQLGLSSETLCLGHFSSRWGSLQSRLVSSRRCTASLFVWRCRESYQQNYRALPAAVFSCPAVCLVHPGHPGTLVSILFLNSVRTPGSPPGIPFLGHRRYSKR